jgi:hypothetical protein
VWANTAQSTETDTDVWHGMEQWRHIWLYVRLGFGFMGHFQYLAKRPLWPIGQSRLVGFCTVRPVCGLHRMVSDWPKSNKKENKLKKTAFVMRSG